MRLGRVAVLVNAAASFYMLGVIVFAQVAHYPLLATLPPALVPGYETANLRLMTLVVALPMALEGAAALWLARRRPPWVEAPLPWLGLALLALIWLSTALVQYPEHRALAAAYDAQTLRRLLLSNWVRTAAWAARAAVAARMLWTSAR